MCTAPSSQGLEMSLELTETKENLEESLEALSRVPTPPLDEQTEQEVHKMEVQEVVRTLEDTLSQKQWPRAIQLLRSARYRRQRHPVVQTTILSTSQEALERSGRVWQWRGG